MHLYGCIHNKEYRALGSILGPPIPGNYQLSSDQPDAMAGLDFVGSSLTKQRNYLDALAVFSMLTGLTGDMRDPFISRPGIASQSILVFNQTAVDNIYTGMALNCGALRGNPYREEYEYPHMIPHDGHKKSLV